MSSIKMTFAIVSLALLSSLVGTHQSSIDDEQCRYQIVESMPDKLEFNSSLVNPPQATHESLLDLINNAKTTLDIASFYWMMNPPEPEFAVHPSSLPGRNIMDAIVRATKRGVKLQVILDRSGKQMSNPDDVDKLESVGVVKFLNMTALMRSGVMHSKFLIADQESVYLGSSNFDWRSYTQIKEIGLKLTNCKTLALDLGKIFNTYVYISDLGHVPKEYPDELHTKINLDHPIEVSFNQIFTADVFLGSAPPSFNGADKWTGRTDDIDGLLSIIDKARHSIHISVMNYSPRTAFIWPKKFWPKIDNALRRAASERKVKVQLLFSNWSHAKPEELMWYKSLNAVQSPALSGGGIQVKMFKVPSFDKFQAKIPYARVKHDKYLVTDNGLFIGTSNWSPDYFINTCGASFVIKPHDMRQNNTIVNEMQALFLRDWTSDYSTNIS